MVDLAAYPEIEARLEQFNGLQALGEIAMELDRQASLIEEAIGKVGVRATWLSKLVQAPGGIRDQVGVLEASMDELGIQAWEVPSKLRIVLAGDTVADLGIQERMPTSEAENTDWNWGWQPVLVPKRGIGLRRESSGTSRLAVVANRLVFEPAQKRIWAYYEKNLRATYSPKLERSIMSTEEVERNLRHL